MHKHGFHSGKRDGTHHKGIKRYRHSPWFQEMVGRKGGRIERGEIKYLILDALKEKNRHGYDIIQRILEKTGGTYRPSPGALYPALQLLEDQEMISSSMEGKRRVYELMGKGREEIEAKGFVTEDIYEDMRQGRDSGWEEFFEKAHTELTPMFRSIARSFRGGELEADKADEVLDIVRETAKKVVDVLNNNKYG